MNVHTILTVFCVGVQLHCYVALESGEDLINRLVNYDRRQPPHGAKGPGSPVRVIVSMYILDVIKLDDIKEELTTHMYFRQTWRDPRLRYVDGNEKTKFLNFEDLKKIWTPDVYFVNEQHGKMGNIVFPNAIAKWSSDGNVFTSVRLTMTTRCKMDLAYYPHDIQICAINFETFGHSADTVEVLWQHGVAAGRSLGITDSPLEQNYKISDPKTSAHHETLASGNYTQLRVHLTFERKTGFFATKLYIPYILLSIISWLSLWINPKFVQLRLSLLLSVLFTMSLIAIEMNFFIPRVAYTKAIDVWIAFCISFVFALFLEFIFITQKSKSEQLEDPVEITTSANLLGKDEKESKGFLPLQLKFLKLDFYSENHVSHNVDQLSRWIIPLLFGLFNLIYWCVCAT